jgi:hypothetical protein
MTPRLVSIEQVAVLLHVPATTAWRWSCSSDFPTPVAEHSGRWMWFCEDVIAWHQTHRS